MGDGDFDVFFLDEYPKVVSALMLLERASPAEADDCVQHAMVELLQRWGLPATDRRRVRNPRAYAIQTARRRFRSEWLRNRTVVLDEDVPAPEPAAADNGELVEKVFERLSPEQREVMELVVEGFGHAEIARLLRKKPNNVRQIVFQSKKRLRPLLKRSSERKDSDDE